MYELNKYLSFTRYTHVWKKCIFTLNLWFLFLTDDVFGKFLLIAQFVHSKLRLMIYHKIYIDCLIYLTKGVEMFTHMLEKESEKQKDHEYIFSESHYEKSRLERLNEVYNPESLAILSPYVHEGMSVLEIGPGTGEIAEWLVQQIGESGSYTGLDIGESNIAILRDKIPSARFIQGSVLENTLFEEHFSSQKFDLIYFRWVLSYTPEDTFRDTLAKLYLHLSQGGHLICEEFDLYASHCTQSSDTSCRVSHVAFNKWLALSQQVDEQLQANFSLGETILTLLQEVTIGDAASTSSITYQPTFSTRRHKEILSLGMLSARTALVGSGIKREESYDNLASDLDGLAQDDSINVKYIQNTVAIAEKPRGFGK